jgi:hypothetical protein
VLHVAARGCDGRLHHCRFLAIDVVMLLMLTLIAAGIAAGAALMIARINMFLLLILSLMTVLFGAITSTFIPAMVVVAAIQVGFVGWAILSSERTHGSRCL